MRTLLPALVTLFLPALAFAATPRTFGELVNMIVGILNAVTVLLVLAAVVTFLYNISSNLGKAGEAKNNLKSIILWGILTIFLMVSIWGILRILQTTLFGDSTPIT